MKISTNKPRALLQSMEIDLAQFHLSLRLYIVTIITHTSCQTRTYFMQNEENVISSHSLSTRSESEFTKKHKVFKIIKDRLKATQLKSVTKIMFWVQVNTFTTVHFMQISGVFESRKKLSENLPGRFRNASWKCSGNK